MTQAVNLAALGSVGVSTGFKNRIINGAMQIWQRGTSVAVSGDAYTGADRWKAGGQVWTGAQSADVPAGCPSPYSLQITSSSGSYGTFSHRIESINCMDLAGKDITISFYAKNVSGLNHYYLNVNAMNAQDNFSGASTNLLSTTLDIVSGSWNRYSFTITNLPAVVANGIQINMYNDSSAGAVNKWSMFQLEVGTQATNFEIRPYATELALCQRYCLTLSGGSENGGHGFGNGSAYFHSFVHAPTPMRTTPTITWPGTINNTNYSSNLSTITGVGGVGFNANAPAFKIIYSLNSSPSAQPCGLNPNGNLVLANAEL